jgi:hypothetical protein
MEEGVLIVSTPLIQLGKICIQRFCIDIHTDMCFIICPIGHQSRHNAIHCGNVLLPDAVFPVSPFSLLFSHNLPSVIFFVKDRVIIAKSDADCNPKFDRLSSQFPVTIKPEGYI